VVFSREPGGTALGEQIRKILLDPKNKRIDVASEVLLYMAARRQVVQEVVLPALKNGSVVLLDRFLDATVCYQGYGGGFSIRKIKRMGRDFLAGLTPDLTIVLDILPRAGLAKCRRKDRMERKSLAFHRRVRHGYLELARQQPRRVKIIPVQKEVASTQQMIRALVDKTLH
jgi:dTMP kinase